MKNVLIAALLAATLNSGIALAQDASTRSAPARKRAGVALQFELASGGDELYNDEIHASRTNLGQGGTLSVGGFYRPVESSPFELQGLIGYKMGWPLPFRSDEDDADVTRWVLQLLGNYRTDDKWYVGGGLAYHVNPKYVDNYPGALDIDFDNAVGAVLEAGWSWIGVQCTYMEYRTDQYGKFDASNCGVRFTFRFGR